MPRNAVNSTPQLRQSVNEVGGRLDPAIQVFQVEVLVRPMGVAVGITQAHHQRVGPEHLLEQGEDRQGPTFAAEDGLRADPGPAPLRGGAAPGRAQGAPLGGASGVRGHFHPHARRGGGADRLIEGLRDSPGNLVGHDPHGDLAHHLARDDCRSSLAGDSAVQPVYVGRAQRRSRVVKPLSPSSAGAPVNARYPASSNGRASSRARSSSVSSRTLS